MNEKKALLTIRITNELDEKLNKMAIEMEKDAGPFAKVSKHSLSCHIFEIGYKELLRSMGEDA